MNHDPLLIAYLIGKRDGYAAALRDAVEAVKAVPHVAGCGALCPCCMGDYDCSCGRRDAVAVIEALGGDE